MALSQHILTGEQCTTILHRNFFAFLTPSFYSNCSWKGNKTLYSSAHAGNSY